MQIITGHRFPGWIRTSAPISNHAIATDVPESVPARHNPPENLIQKLNERYQLQTVKGFWGKSDKPEILLKSCILCELIGGGFGCGVQQKLTPFEQMVI